LQSKAEGGGVHSFMESKNKRVAFGGNLIPEFSLKSQAADLMNEMN
jgi:hypothetical protein